MKTGLRLAALAGVLLLFGSCTRLVRIPAEDWGAVTPDVRVRVTLVDGEQFQLSRPWFGTEALHGFVRRQVPLDGEPERVGAARRPTFSTDSVAVPLDSIDAIEVNDASWGAPVLVGLAAVGATIAIIAANGEDRRRPAAEPRPSTPFPSCPFLYSWDGSAWTLDSETFSGAVTRGLQRSDLDNLEHLRAVEGVYRLRLANERPETQYTDAVGVVVVDHPTGTEVFPDARGAYHGLQRASAPLRAHGLRGADVRAAVEERDGIWWEGDDLASVEGADPGELRDGMILTFDHPAAERGLLAVHAINTPLAPFALRQFLDAQGDDLVSWYRKVDRDPDERARVRRWIHREAMLLVSIWKDGMWELQDALMDVGPNLPKTQVATLDLRGVTGSEVRVRIESARGLWAVDEVRLGRETDAGLEVRELSPRRATGRDGRDVTAEIASSDSRYHMATRGDVVHLEFAAPDPPPTGTSRTVLARTSGFYHLHTDHWGRTAHPDVADRMLDEPGYAARYVLERLRHVP